MVEKRDKLRIVYDILVLLQQKEKVKPTHVLYGGNLSHQRLKKYMNELENNGMVEVLKEEDKMFYKITDKGLNFLMETKKIRDVMDAFGV